MKWAIYAVFLISIVSSSLQAQLLKATSGFTRADSLRGMLTPLRTCYDINYYHLDVTIDIKGKMISGSNEFQFTATQDFDKLQFDLFENLRIEKILYKGQELKYTRQFNAVFVTFLSPIKKGSRDAFKVFYSGKPLIAKNPPWDGGFIFTRDRKGNPWVSVACQGLGASSWWPNKDHQSDEVDSMMVSLHVPEGLQAISNGRLREKTTTTDGYSRYSWFVSNPINNYNVAFYIGKYANWTDQYAGEKGNLSLSYWSLASDSTTARPHWNADVKPMLRSFEHWFGPYPFYEDGYKLVQSPFLGMEHQSAIAYGNGFKKGYLGTDYSGSAAGWGLKFDYITIHESGHEWFGNNITAKDIADMWIHEGFTSYSEVLFLDSYYGKQAGLEYIVGSRKVIENMKPIIGTYHVNSEGSGDMYYKGANLIHMIRTLMNDDEKFRMLLRGMGKDFYHKTVTTSEIESYLSEKSGLELSKIFDQYLRHAKLPVLEYKIKGGVLTYRWLANVEGFDMPVKVTLKNGKFNFIYPTTSWKSLGLDPEISSEVFKVDPNFYIRIKNA